MVRRVVATWKPRVLLLGPQLLANLKGLKAKWARRPYQVAWLNLSYTTQLESPIPRPWRVVLWILGLWDFTTRIIKKTSTIQIALGWIQSWSKGLKIYSSITQHNTKHPKTVCSPFSRWWLPEEVVSRTLVRHRMITVKRHSTRQLRLIWQRSCNSIRMDRSTLITKIWALLIVATFINN